MQAQIAISKKNQLNSGRGRKKRVVRTNINCKICSRELRKREGEVCDECRFTQLGWKKSEPPKTV